MIKISEDEETTTLKSTTLTNQGYQEENLREWILDDPETILDEEILIIGREVEVKDIGDGVDLLGIDPDGNLVVIELKKGSLSGNVDFQSLKYAAYSSYWDWSQIADQFDKFVTSKWGQELYEGDVDFNEKLESFCNDEYELNQNQRILLVGESIRERLDLVVRWLSSREVEVSVLEVEMLKDGNQLYLDTEQTIPVTENTVSGVSPETSKEPWKDDGKSWHLNEKLDSGTAERLEEVIESLENVESLDGPYWGQKQYVSFKQKGKNRVIAQTRTRVFHLQIYDIRAGDIDKEELAEVIGVPSEDVKADGDDLRDGRPGIQVTCRGEIEFDTTKLATKVGEYLSGEE